MWGIGVTDLGVNHSVQGAIRIVDLLIRLRLLHIILL